MTTSSLGNTHFGLHSAIGSREYPSQARDWVNNGSYTLEKQEKSDMYVLCSHHTHAMFVEMHFLIPAHIYLHNKYM